VRTARLARALEKGKSDPLQMVGYFGNYRENKHYSEARSGFPAA
jgi:hypothetical protein